MKDPAFLFYPNDWHTPNTYDTNYKEPGNISGVYLLVEPNYANNTNNILYVGSAKNLKQRYKKHEVLRILKETYGYIRFYFKEEINYRSVEKFLIKQIQPKYNKQWR